MSVVRELVTVWGFDIDEKPLKNLEEKFGALKETAKHLAEVFVGIITGEGGGLLGLAAATSHAAIEAQRMSTIFGISTGTMQGLSYAAKLSQVDIGSLSIGLRTLSLHVSQMGTGNAAGAQAFARLGISAKDSRGELKKTDQLLFEMADAFKGIENTTLRAGLAQQIFGRHGATLLPLLVKGSAGIREEMELARSYGAVLDEKAVEAGKRFNKVTEEGQVAITGLKNVLGLGLMPAMTDFVRGILDWYKANQAVIQQKLNELLNELVPQFIKLGGVVISMVGGVYKLTEALGGLANVLRLILSTMAALATFRTVMSLLATIGLVLTGVGAPAAIGAHLARYGILYGLGAAGAAGVGTYMATSPTSSPFSSIPPIGSKAGGNSTTFVQPVFHNTFTGIESPKEHARIMGDQFQDIMNRAAATFGQHG